MRIGLVIYGELSTLSGGYLYDRKLVGYLRAQGDSVEVISLPVGPYWKAVRHNFDSNIRKRLASLAVDILLQDELNHPSLFLLNPWIRQRGNYRLIGIVHHLRCREDHPIGINYLYKGLEKRFLNGLDGLIYNSDATRESVNQLGIEPKPGIVAVPGADNLVEENYIRQNIAHSQNWEITTDNPLRILFVGNIIKRKNLLTLVKGLQLLRGKPWQLAVVGREEVDPAYTRECKKEVERSRMTNQITFLGSLDDSDLLNYYQQSHILAVPSFFEGYGIVYSEAMQWGVIPLTGKAGGASEIITDGVNGWLVDPRSEESIAQAIGFALDHPVQMEKMSIAAKLRSQKFSTWQETSEMIRNFLISQVDY